jgi:CrcB protein
MTYFLVAIGGALGSMARYWCSSVISERTAAHFPWLGIVVVNVIGSFLIGAALGLFEPGSRLEISSTSRSHFNEFFMIGVLGGYTTFSSFSLWTLNLVRDHQWWAAGANIFLSFVLCLTSVALGFWCASLLAQR